MRSFLIFSLFTSLALLSPFIGAIDLNVRDILDPAHLSHQIFFEIRLPRMLLAFCGGVILALGGLVFQTLFRNALMTPYTLGISSGAVLGAGVAIKLGVGAVIFGVSAVSIFGFLGALVTLGLLLYLARFLRSSHSESLLLLGIALSLFFTSALMILFFLGNSVQNDMLLRFTMGSLSILGWREPLFVAILSFVLLLVLFAYRFELQLLSVSNEAASLRGVDTKKVTTTLLLILSLGVGVLVSITGPIGFIGLIIPHIVAKIYPQSLQHRIGKTALFGGFFLLFCDTIARSLTTQSELPIGIVTALIGGPFFIYLIITKGKS
jgi:iron complex transport system permease protein